MAQAREPAETERRSRPALLSRLGSPRIPGPSSVDSPLSAAAVLHLQRVAGNRAAAERVQARDGERRVQRLTVASTRWNDATSARLTTSGSVGAAIVEEANAPSVVVKANEPMTDELAIATNLANAVGSSKKYPFSAPEVRTAGAEESDVIAAMLTRTFPSGSSEKVRQDTFVTKLRNPTTVIFAYAPGKDYDQIVAEASRPRTSLTKTLTFRSESARWADALVDPDYYQALGRVTALDIFLYNRDRVVNANTGNWRVDLDAKSVSLIDNVFKSGLGSVLTDTRSEGRARAGLGAWWGWDLAQKLCSGRLAEIAEEVVPNLYKSGIRDPLAQAKKEREAEGLAKIWEREKSQCTAAFATGLRAGRDALLEALREPERFVQGVADAQRHVALTALYARRAALEGSADPASAEAWRSAERLAEPHRERSLSST